MSRLTQFIHDRFGTGAANESAADIVLRYIPDTGSLGAVKEVVTDVVAVMQGTGLSGDEKKKLATVVITGALAAMHLNVPAAVVSFLIEEAVLLLKGGKSTPKPAPAPSPAPDPTSVEYDTLDEAKAHTSAAYPVVIQKDNGKFIVWTPLVPYPSGGKQVYP